MEVPARLGKTASAEGIHRGDGVCRGIGVDSQVRGVLQWVG